MDVPKESSKKQEDIIIKTASSNTPETSEATSTVFSIAVSKPTVQVKENVEEIVKSTTSSKEIEDNQSLKFDSQKETSIEELKFRRNVPRMNCPEKIIFCIDLASDMQCVPFTFGDGTSHSPFFMVKRIIDIFINVKSDLDQRHEFALVIFLETALWIKNFTSNINDIQNTLESLQETKICETFDFSSLFDLLDEKIKFPDYENGNVLCPPHVVRTIFIYGRSQCIPQLDKEREVFVKFQKNPFFFMDILYIHDPPSQDNHCQEIFESFCDLDEKYTSYIFEVTRNVTKLHNHMAKLLSHPLQRTLQKDAYYTLKEDSPTE